ncbi:MAG TPA: hypothetical protein VF322_16845 [Gammaproteobacteria bacterium]
MRKQRHLVLGAALFAAATAAAEIPRAYDGHPDLTGIWKTTSTANWNLEDHGPEAGPYWQLGTLNVAPPGRGVVVGGKIPYKPEALAKREENRAKRWREDPEAKCYMPGIPRATYMPYPFAIVQGTNRVLMAYQFASANRNIYMDEVKEPAVDTWMGTANGHWEGDTLVVDNRGFNDLSWFDRSGNYHSNQLHVVERYTMVSENQIDYEATIEDPQVFTRPWKIELTLYRDIESQGTLPEYKCVEYSERLLYSDLSGPNAPPETRPE